MREPDVTLTDYGLVLECAACAALLAGIPTNDRRVRAAGVCFFVFLGLSAATGGTVHGFFPDEQSPGHRLLWTVTLLLVGLAACSTWITGAGLVATGRARNWFVLAGIAQVVVYQTLVLLVTQTFWIAFTIYLPGMLLLAAGFTRQALWMGLLGTGVSLMSCLVQFLRIGISPTYFNHNALAHVVQAVALALIFLGIRSGCMEKRVVPAHAISPDSA